MNLAQEFNAGRVAKVRFDELDKIENQIKVYYRKKELVNELKQELAKQLAISIEDLKLDIKWVNYTMYFSKGAN